MLTRMFYHKHLQGYLRIHFQQDKTIIYCCRGKKNLVWKSVLLTFGPNFGSHLRFWPLSVELTILKCFHCIWHLRKHMIRCWLCQNQIIRSWNLDWLYFSGTLPIKPPSWKSANYGTLSTNTAVNMDVLY